MITEGCGKKDTDYNFVRNEKLLQGLERQMTFSDLYFESITLDAI